MRSHFNLLIISVTILTILSSCDADSITTPPENGDDSQSEMTIGGSGEDQGNTILQTGDGGYLITGTAASSDGDFSGLNRGEEDIFAMKLSSTGNLQWLKTFGGSAGDRALDAIEDFRGNFVITGHTRSGDGQFANLNRGENDLFLIKISPDGNLIWSRTYGGSDEDYGYAVVQEPNGNYVITGSTRSTDWNFSNRSSSDKDIFILRTLNDGTINLVRTYGGSQDEEGRDVAIGSNFQISVTGVFESNNGDFSGAQPGTGGAFLLKIESSGVFNSLTTYSGSGTDVANTLIPVADGGFVIAGRSSSGDGLFQVQNSGTADAFLLKMTNNGNPQWINLTGGSDYEEIHTLIESESGNIIAAGETRSGDLSFEGLSRGGLDAFLLSISSDGTTDWLETYGGSNAESALSITETVNGDLAFTGWTLSNDGNFTGPQRTEKDIYKLIASPDGELQ